jgi:O-antigen ligase
VVTADAQWVDQVLEAARPEADGPNSEDDTPRVKMSADLRAHLPSVVVLATVAWWLMPAALWWGGRDVHAVSGGAILTAAAVAAVRPDRLLPHRAVILALAVSGGAMLVAATAPTGWSGATNAAEYVCAAWTALCVAAAVVRDRRIVFVLLALLVLGVMIEIRAAWLPWWGGENSTAPMRGTFYWHNPFAIYLLPGAVLGLVMWLRRTRLIGWLGLGGFALGAIGIFYSTSRASLACFIAAVVVTLVAHVFTTRVRGLVRAAVGIAGTTALVWMIGGPPFFPHQSHSPVAGLAARAAGQSLGQNGSYRLDFWREALGVFSRHPVTGGGYHSMATASADHNPHHWPLSPLAHNGYLQALSDGGLLLGVPFLLACAVVCWWVLAALWEAVRRREFGLTSFAVPLVLAALLAHSAVDFDWSYPADLLLTAILAGLVAGERWLDRTPAPGSTRWTASLAAFAGVGLLIVGAVVARDGDLHLNLPVASGPAASPFGVQQ